MAQNTSADVSGSALTPHPADRSIMQEPKFSDGCDIAYLFSEPLVQQIGTSLQPIQKLDLEKVCDYALRFQSGQSIVSCLCVSHH